MNNPILRFISLTSILFILHIVNGGCNTAKIATESNSEKEDIISIEYPEVYELANIILALTEYGITDKWQVRKDFSYYEEMRKYFEPVQDHALLDSVNFSREKWKEFLSFRTDAYAFSFDNNNKLKRLNNFQAFENKTFDKYKVLIEDFAMKSNFRAFFNDHQSYYKKISESYKKEYFLKEMKSFLVKEFGDHFADKKYSIVLSPFVYAQNLHRDIDATWAADFPNIALPIIKGEAFSKQEEKSTEIHTLFTEMDHGYVNPTTEKHELKGKFQEAYWDDKSGYAGNGSAVFNEYMTWAVFDIFNTIYYPDLAQKINSNWHFQNDSRGFIYSNLFGEKLSELYRKYNGEKAIQELYPEILEWAENIQSTLSKPQLLNDSDPVMISEGKNAIELVFSESMEASTAFDLVLEFGQWDKKVVRINKENNIRWKEDGKRLTFDIQLPQKEKYYLLLNWWGVEKPLKSKKGIMLKARSGLLINGTFAKNNSTQDINVYAEMLPILDEITHLVDFGNLDKSGIVNAVEKLNDGAYGFKKSSSSNFKVSQAYALDPGLDLFNYYDQNQNYSLQMVSGNSENISNYWKKVGDMKEWTGYETYREKFVYMKKDSINNSSVGVLFLSKNAIVSFGCPLPFTIKGRANDQTNEKKKIIVEKLKHVSKIANALSESMVPTSSLIYKASDEKLTAAERVNGFTQFWTEVKYNFAFFDQVPELDWDQVLTEYLPIFIKDQSNVDYFRNLEKVCALLEDGHTNIYPPINDQIDHPAITFINIGKKAIVQNMDESLSGSIPRGAEVIEIDGIKTQDYLTAKVIPYISSSTEYILWRSAIKVMLKGPVGSTVKIKLKDVNGNISEQFVKRNQSSTEVKWKYPRRSRNGLIEFKALENKTAHICLNTFGNGAIVLEFEALLDTLKGFDHFIIDLRNNGGGNSGNGYNILKYFADKPFRSSKWSTRTHQGSFKAWGSFYVKKDDAELSEWELKAKQIYLGKHWYVSEPDTIQPEKKLDFKGDLIVLIGNNTASAAEDFLVALDDLGFGKLIGQPTFGSTGQPLFVRLPRGGNARICTKKDTYPDGREFVGYGIQPDILVEKTVDDFLSGKDIELEAAMRLIKE